MFVGHFAVAFGAKKLAPQVSLGALFLACQLADLIWPDLVLLGIERFSIEPGATALTPLNFEHYPYSHSLLAMSAWGILFAGAYALVSRAGARTVAVIVAVAVSHWVLDVVTHRADMPIVLSDRLRIGLGLWNRPYLAIGVELAMLAGGVWLYTRYTVARDRAGTIGLWSLVGFLVIVYLANCFGPTPPSVAAVAWSAQAMWLLVGWAYWLDGHRRPRSWARLSHRLT